MPQAIAVWCERAGHEVFFHCYTGQAQVTRVLPNDLDVVFVSAFTHAALLAYATSAFFRSNGSVTILGGPHARAYPNHARQYFDYVLGLTDEDIVNAVLRDCRVHRPTLAALRASLDTDVQLRDFLDGQTTRVPTSMNRRLLAELGPMKNWLPKSSVTYDCRDAPPPDSPTLGDLGFPAIRRLVQL
jgi:hypothetical protein